MTVLFGPDGRDLIVQQIHEPPELGGPPSLLHRYDGATGRPDASPVRVGRHETFLMSSPRDRRTVFVTSESDDETYMFAADGLRLLRRWPVGAYAGTVSPDGRTFALGSQDGAVRLLDLATGLVRRLAGGHEARVLRMRFSADGRTLVTSGEDGAVRAWDVQRGEVRRVFAGHALGVVWGADIVPDGRTVYSAGQDKRAFAWDLDGDRSLVRPFDVDRAFVPDDGDTLPRGLALAPDGRTLAVGHSDGGVDLIEADTLRTGARFRALRGFVAALAFSPDRNVLAATGQHGELALWDARPLRRLGELRGQRTTSQALAFSPDGTLLAAGDLGTPNSDYSVYTGGGVRVFDLRRRVATKFWPRLTLVSLAFSPDGRLLAMAAMESFTQIRDLRSGRLVTTLSTGEADRSVVFSPDGRLVLTGLSTTARRTCGRRTPGSRSGARSRATTTTACSGWGSRPTARCWPLATAGQDGTIELVDVAGHRPIGTPLTVAPDNNLATAMSPDGRHLFVVSSERAAVRWTIDPEEWKRHACRVAGRELTRREWSDALPGRPYRRVCSG